MTADLPKFLHAIALVDAKFSADFGSASVSWWYGQVAARLAPQPVIRQPRFTRWRLQDVLDFWASRAAAQSEETVARTTEQAKLASNAAKRKRIASKAASQCASAPRKTAWKHAVLAKKDQQRDGGH